MQYVSKTDSPDLHIDKATRLPDLTPKWVRLAGNQTNLNFLRLAKKVLKTYLQKPQIWHFRCFTGYYYKLSITAKKFFLGIT